jgi:hypothetical protein
MGSDSPDTAAAAATATATAVTATPAATAAKQQAKDAMELAITTSVIARAKLLQLKSYINSARSKTTTMQGSRFAASIEAIDRGILSVDESTKQLEQAAAGVPDPCGQRSTSEKGKRNVVLRKVGIMDRIDIVDLRIELAGASADSDLAIQIEQAWGEIVPAEVVAVSRSHTVSGRPIVTLHIKPTKQLAGPAGAAEVEPVDDSPAMADAVCDPAEFAGVVDEQALMGLPLMGDL